MAKFGWEDDLFNELDEEYTTKEKVEIEDKEEIEEDKENERVKLVYRNRYIEPEVTNQEKEQMREEIKERVLSRFKGFESLKTEESKAVEIEEGFTVADYLNSRKRKAKSEVEVIGEVIEKNIDAIVSKKAVDDKYVMRRKHTSISRNQRKQMKVQDDGKKDFLAIKRGFNRNDKRVMKNLQIPRSMYKEFLFSEDISREDKALILSKVGGHKVGVGNVPYKEKDVIEILSFLSKFKFSGLKPLADIIGRSRKKTKIILDRMENQNYVTKHTVIDSKTSGFYQVWGLTQFSKKWLKTKITPYRKTETLKKRFIASIIPVRYVVSCLWRNKYNVLLLEDFPFSGKPSRAKGREGEKVRGEDMVSEEEIRVSFGTEKWRDIPRKNRAGAIARLGPSAKRVYERQQALWNHYDVYGGVSPELEKDREFMWVLMHKDVVNKEFHFPDLVLKRPRKSDGSQGHIAVEVEMSNKGPGKYRSTLDMYNKDDRLYDKVIWIVNRRDIATSLLKAAKEINMNMDKLKIIPFTRLNQEGEVESFEITSDMWIDM